MAWNNKGASLSAQSKYDEAIKACDEAIKLDPNLAIAWDNKGQGLSGQSKYDEAIKCFDEALRLDPNFAKTKNNRDTALKALERTSEAGAANFYTPSSQKSITSDSSSNSNRCDQVVHVKGYTTKKGKYVAPYDRRPPGC
jgi:tetratricopeptide (TPR) repeat protein